MNTEHSKLNTFLNNLKSSTNNKSTANCYCKLNTFSTASPCQSQTATNADLKKAQKLIQ